MFCLIRPFLRSSSVKTCLLVRLPSTSFKPQSLRFGVLTQDGQVYVSSGAPNPYSGGSNAYLWTLHLATESLNLRTVPCGTQSLATTNVGGPFPPLGRPSTPLLCATSLPLVDSEQSLRNPRLPDLRGVKNRPSSDLHTGEGDDHLVLTHSKSTPEPTVGQDPLLVRTGRTKGTDG